GDGDGAEFARRAVGGGDALLHGLRLAHQGDVAGGGFVPAGGDADEGLVDLLARQTHRVVIRAMRRAGGPLGHVAARQPRLVERLGVHLLTSKREVRREKYGVGATASQRFGPTFLRLSPKLEPLKALSADAPPTGADFSKFYGANEAQKPQLVAI